MNDLENKVVIITGAAKGIGRGIAQEMCQAGARVVLVDIHRDALIESEHQLQSQKHAVSSYAADVSNYEENNRLVQFVLDTFGTIDVLVNNAGFYQDDHFLDATVEKVEQIYRTNVLGPFFLTQRVVQEMVSRKIKGSILFTSSTHSQVTIMRPAYSSSKAAIEMFIRDVALEVAEYGIRVNGVAPGAIDIWALEDNGTEHVPLGHLGKPVDIGRAMVFLSSDNASYITGQTITVDGAFSLAHTHYWQKKGKL